MSNPPKLSALIVDGNASLTALIVDLAHLYRLPLEADTVDRVLEFLGVKGAADIRLDDFSAKAVAFPGNARGVLQGRSPLESELIDFLAPQYDKLFGVGQPLHLEWPVYALMRPEYPDRLTTDSIDLTGPARFLFYGPYFALPASHWRAEIEFDLADCHSENVVGIDIFAEKVLSAVRTRLPPSGSYGCDLWFQIDDPSRPVELRMRLLTGAIEGEISLRRIRLTREAPLASQVAAQAAAFS